MSIWGVANPFAVPLQLANVSDTACPAATPTVVGINTVFAAPQGANAFPFAFVTAVFLLGATAPTALKVAFAFGGGADITAYIVPPALLVNNATIVVNFTGIGVSSRSAWLPGTNALNVYANPTTNAVTFKTVGSLIWMGLALGSDS